MQTTNSLLLDNSHMPEEFKDYTNQQKTTEKRTRQRSLHNVNHKVVFEDGEEDLLFDFGNNRDNWGRNSLAPTSSSVRPHRPLEFKLDTPGRQTELKIEETKQDDLPQGAQIRFKIERAELLNMKTKHEVIGSVIERDDPKL